ncbi:MAG: hypothetical protein R3E42_15550 [Burkholderiaceae bacterium]
MTVVDWYAPSPFFLPYPFFVEEWEDMRIGVQSAAAMKHEDNA